MQKYKLKTKIAAVAAAASILVPASFAFATGTSNFQQTINPGTLATGIVDGSYVAVGSPSVTMSAATFAFTCQTVTGTFGTSGQKIYIVNPDAADNGWTLTLAASAATDVWNGVTSTYDFNDPTSSGCADGADADSIGGQMTVNPAAATLAVGACASCTTSNISKGSSTAYNQGTTNNITLLTAAASSNDVGDWTLTGVGISQTLPAEQAAASDYNINMVLTVTAS
ncbi:MAG: hypothetical protein KIH62_005205 [Candidatus Kerfeldbacteria bacterium]|nr:hypothetical protein [Candidatus Kerfeldbacteria bacterium]